DARATQALCLEGGFSACLPYLRVELVRSRGFSDRWDRAESRAEARPLLPPFFQARLGPSRGFPSLPRFWDKSRSLSLPPMRIHPSGRVPQGTRLAPDKLLHSSERAQQQRGNDWSRRASV